MNSPKLYGVGLGPGAPDLVTVRAVNVLNQADVLALPRASDWGTSVAWQIARAVVPEQSAQERLLLTFPMSRDPARVSAAVEHAADVLVARLQQGQSVAFATEGDPSLFSTFIYVREALCRRMPGLEVEVVPGVSSVMTVAAVSGVPLADGQERIAILPAAYGTGDLGRVLDEFDTTVLMKLGPELPNVIELLEQRGLLESAVYVSRASMREQRIVRDVRTVKSERGDCFAMMIVAKKQRNGVLVRENPHENLGEPA